MKKKAKHCTSTNNGKYGMKILVLLLVLSLSLFPPLNLPLHAAVVHQIAKHLVLSVEP